MAGRLPVWLQLLAVEYASTKRSVDQQELLAAVYQGEDEELLRKAAIRYLKHEEFYPSVASFRPYVRYEHEVRPYLTVKATWPTDEELLAFEQEAGTMPPNEELHEPWAVILQATGLLVVDEIAEITPERWAKLYDKVENN